MNLKAISRYVGSALLASAVFMFAAAVIALLSKDGAFGPLLISFLITGIFGAFPFIFVRKASEMSLREGYLTIMLSWLFSFIFGMLPYALWGGPFTLANAWFESVSGFTTTGATILEDIEALPRSLLFWRASTHFIGGLGVVVFLLLIIPNSSPVRLRLTNMELNSLSRSGYSTRANRTVYIFAYVYLGICLAAFICYWIAGMDLFDALCHAMSVCATGGFSTRNLSIGAYGSPVIELVTMVFMVLASCHFGLIYLAIVNRSLKPLNNPVLKFYLITLTVFSLALSVSLVATGNADSLGDAIHMSFFQCISVASTTGFAIVDNVSWGMENYILLMFLGFMCGCAGSTTGGVRADRVLILFKSIARQIKRTLHPSSVNEVKMGSRVFRDDELTPHVLYIGLYGILLAFSVLLSMQLGVGANNAFAASVSALGNVGPAAFELGNMGNFNHIPIGAKVLFSVDMFLGRVEIYPVLGLLAMLFERRRR